MSMVMAQASDKDILLPPLRDELTLHQGGVGSDGAPNWILEDPLSNRYFRIGWLEFEILSRWFLGSANEVLADLQDRSTLSVERDDIETVLRFVANNNLMQIRGEQAVSRLMEQSSKLKRYWPSWLLKNYLFLRLPLVRPNAFLATLLPWVAWLGSRPFRLLTIFVGLVGIMLVAQQWDVFLNSFQHFFSFWGVLAMAGALVFAKVAHELGHGFAAVRYGCRVPTMGVAFLVLWPVLYTDASASWKLKARKQRLTVASAGMLVELYIAAYAIFLWNLMPDGPLRSAVFLLATTTWILTLLVNLNPLLRFDGYYLLSDVLGVPNLQERAFAFGRWQLREWIFGFNDLPPEFFQDRLKKILLLYAYGTWVYRFFLFLAIALIVYFFFFKVLGIFLMVVEVIWFIGRPIYKEMAEWTSRGKKMRLNKNTLFSLITVLSFVLLIFYPWRATITAPAVWRLQEHSRIYAPSASIVEDVLISVGDRVAESQLLMKLHSPDLEHEIETGARQLEMLDWLVQYKGLNEELLARAPVTSSEYAAAMAAQMGRLAERDKLSVGSAITGVVEHLKESLRKGDWVADGEYLGLVIQGGDQSRIEAYVDERFIERIDKGQRGRFFPSDPLQRPFDAVIAQIDAGSTRVLDEAYQASPYGGLIAVRENDRGELVPEKPVYRVVLVPTDSLDSPARVTTGVVSLESRPESIALGLSRRVWGILLRESGF